MSDFGLDDKVTDEYKLLAALRWHGLAVQPDAKASDAESPAAELGTRLAPKAEGKDNRTRQK